jgi:hypothetical protein
LAYCLQPVQNMNTLFLFMLLAVPTSQAEEDCGQSNDATDLQAALSVAPTINTNTAPGIQLSDKAFAAIGLRPEVFALAKTAFEKAWNEGKTRKTVYTIIDYGLNSDKKRMWIIDMMSGKLLYNEYVSHGKNSGLNSVTSLSNVDSSKQSNIGLLKTAETYYGKHGLSLKMDGLEAGFNNQARDRYIVIHGASYATEGFVRANGRLGRSHGCPAIDPAVSKKIIEKIKGGSLVFGHYPDSGWLKRSRYLN